jgi:RNase P subunit RPR2
MLACPKCKSFRISGPTYVRLAYGEALEYVCMCCGYRKKEPTADADKTPRPVGADRKQIRRPAWTATQQSKS